MKIESESVNGEIEVHLGKNDIIVIEVNGIISREQSTAIHDAMMKKIKSPGNHVIVVDNGCSVKVIHRDEMQDNET